MSINTTEKYYNCNTTTDIYFLSQYCTTEVSVASYECFKFYSNFTNLIRKISGIWLLIVGIVGISGNLATLITIPYAAKRKRHGLHKNYFTTTIFILHFSFIDLLHCIFLVVPQGIMYSSQLSPFGRYFCKISIYGGVVTLVADMLAIAIVALSRCLDMVAHQKWTDFCDKKRNISVLILLSWVPGMIALLISLIIESHGIEPGWNCETGGCGFIRTCRLPDVGKSVKRFKDGLRACESGMGVWRLSYFSTIIVPSCSLIIIGVSYVVIYCKVHNSTKYFIDQEQINSSLNERDIKLSKTILILVIMNFFCWLPYVVLITAAIDLTNQPQPATSKHYILRVILVNMFESQYALNFFVYVARSEQYRNAFLDLLPFYNWKRRNSN